MGFSGYQMAPGVLASMKEAAGNYMPEYGNWRFRINPPPEEVTEGEPERFYEPFEYTDVQDDKAAVEPVYETKVEPGDEIMENLSYERAWLDASDEYRAKFNNDKATGIAAMKKWRREHPDEEIDQVGTGTFEPGTTTQVLVEGGVDAVLGGTETTSGLNEVNNKGEIIRNVFTNTTTTGNYDKSLFKKLGEVEGVSQAPLQAPPPPPLSKEEIMANLGSAISTANSQGIRSMGAAADLTGISQDIKDNIYLKSTGENDESDYASREVKENQQNGLSTLQNVGDSAKELFGDEGAIATLLELLSEGEGGVEPSKAATDAFYELATGLVNYSGGMKLDPKNNIVLPIELSGGVTIPVDADYIWNKMIKPNTPQYAEGVEWNNAMDGWYKDGAQGNRFDQANVVNNFTAKLRKDPNATASMFMDPVFGTPLFDRLFGDLNIDNPQEFMMAVLADPEKREEAYAAAANLMAGDAVAENQRGVDSKADSKDKPTAGMSLEEKKKFYQNSTNIA